jgi:hypothetical protein
MQVISHAVHLPTLNYDIACDLVMKESLRVVLTTAYNLNAIFHLSHTGI